AKIRSARSIYSETGPDRSDHGLEKSSDQTKTKSDQTIPITGVSAGNFEISDEWNKLLPDYEFTQPKEFLREAWAAIDAGAKSVHTD
ncbi:hypothetical protein NW755_014615, partial [Fusarium falciforme]